MARGGFARGRAGTSVKERVERGYGAARGCFGRAYRALSAAYLQESPHYCAHHVPEKTVGGYAEVPVSLPVRGVLGLEECDVGGRIRVPCSLGDGADGGLVVGAGLLEAGEIVSADE